MRFWDDEIEAMRPEACQCVADRIGLLRSAFNDRPPPAPDLDRFERATLLRSSFPHFPPHPAGRDREIDGVPCRVFLPPASAPPRSTCTSTGAAWCSGRRS